MTDDVWQAVIADMAQDYREVNRRVVAEEEKSGSNSG